MAEITCSVDVRLCVRSGPVNETSLKRKATDFRFETHVPRDSPDTIP